MSPTDSSKQLEQCKEKYATSYPKNKIKVLLLESVAQTAVNLFKDENFQVECHTGSLPEDELIEKMKDAHIVGVRSKTKLTKRVLDEGANKLKAIGCFCIGTDQTDLSEAEKKGIPVFNSPFANTRSVAELAMSEIVALARRVPEHIQTMHKGSWYKTAKECYEVRQKTLGIIGYGHVGSQLGLLAEAFGMHVQFYDIEHKLPLGIARACTSMEEVLKTSDFVSFHVPKTDATHMMVKDEQIRTMKERSYLMNLSRGTVVDTEALAKALKDGHLAGAAVDVYPSEPKGNGEGVFESPLVSCPNTILTPHIGGSTQEAQRAIGTDVASKLVKYMNKGATLGSVNFPEIQPVDYEGCHRLLHIHTNKHGVLKQINHILQEYNVVSQFLGTTKEIGYMVVEVDKGVSIEVFEQLRAIDSTIKARVLF